MGREGEYEDWLDECWSDGRTRRAIFNEVHQKLDAAVRAKDFAKYSREIDLWLERMKGKVRGG